MVTWPNFLRCPRSQAVTGLFPCERGRPVVMPAMNDGQRDEKPRRQDHTQERQKKHNATQATRYI